MACILCRTGTALAAAGLAAVAGLSLTSADLAVASTQTPAADGAFVLTHTMPLLDGTEQNLADFKGRVVLIVNTASRCGLTGQYAGLQELYDAKRDEGFVILGFPANNFMNQEPGTDEQIAEFCQKNYG